MRKPKIFPGVTFVMSLKWPLNVKNCGPLTESAYLIGCQSVNICLSFFIGADRVTGSVTANQVNGFRLPGLILEALTQIVLS